MGKRCGAAGRNDAAEAFPLLLRIRGRAAWSGAALAGLPAVGFRMQRILGGARGLSETHEKSDVERRLSSFSCAGSMED